MMKVQKMMTQRYLPITRVASLRDFRVALAARLSLRWLGRAAFSPPHLSLSQGDARAVAG